MLCAIDHFSDRRFNTDILWHKGMRWLLLALLSLVISGIWIPTGARAQLSVQPHAKASTPQSVSSLPDGVSYDALANLLEDEQMRTQLIEQLRDQARRLPVAEASVNTVPSSSQRSVTDAAQTEVSDAGPTASAVNTELSGSQPGTVVMLLQQFTLNLKDDLAQSWKVLGALFSGRPLPNGDLASWRPALINLAIVVVSALLAYLVLRMLASPVFARMDAWVMRAAPHRVPPVSHEDVWSVSTPLKTSHRRGRKLLAVIGAFFVDIAVVWIASAIAYVVVLSVAAAGTTVPVFTMQFLLAFAGVESAKAMSRAVFATRYERLRLLPMSAQTAVYWNRFLCLIIAVTGYTLMVVFPVVQAILGTGMGRLVSLVLMLAMYCYAVTTVWRNRARVSEGLRNYARQCASAVSGTLLRILARVGHWAVLLYLTVLLIVSQVDQQNAFDFMFHATVQSVLAVVFGLLLAAALSVWLERHIHLPEHWRRALPLLESRVNAYVPACLKSVRLLIMIVVVLVVLDAWRVLDLVQWLSSEYGRRVIGTLIHVGIVLLIAALTWTILASIIEHRLGVSSGKNKPTEREKTLLMLFRSAAGAVIATMTVLIVLSQIGIDIGPLIAGAGVVGLAIGFGAQKLVQDVITGVFIQLENGMNQNDIVEVAGLFGTVEKITIRSVGIRTMDGGYHLIPFSTIDKLTNHTRDYGYHYGEYDISYDQNVDEAIAHLQNAFAELKQDPALSAEILEDISIPGVTSLNERGYTIRVLIKTTPGMQWAVQRAFNRLVKQHFDAAGIERPYPHTVVHLGRDDSGQASPADAGVMDAFRQIKQDQQA